MKYTLAPDEINATALAKFFKQAASIAAAKKNAPIALAEFLAMIKFPKDDLAKIKKARGPLQIDCRKKPYKASNNGKRVSAEIPGTWGALDLTMAINFSCQFTLDAKKGTLVLTKIKGLIADGPAWFNYDVKRMEVKKPSTIMVEI